METELPDMAVLGCSAKRFEYVSVLLHVSQARLQTQTLLGFLIERVRETAAVMWLVLVKHVTKTSQVLFEMTVARVV
jgi:hypothetical protein